MKKKLLSLLLLFVSLFVFASCKKDEPIEDEVFFDNIPTEVDHYFSNKISFADTGTSIKKNSEGKLAGDFIKDKVARLAPKSITDGDTAVFHLNEFEKSATEDGYTNSLGRSYTYLTVRFLGVDTPESTSSIDPWGKAASKYAKSLLETAEGIIVDASDCANQIKSGERLDSNGSRWLALVWYCPDGGNPEDLTQYRLYQLDLIEECYSRYTGAIATDRIAYTAASATEPILYSRYKQTYGSIDIANLLFEAELRMEDLGLRIHGETDPNFDYSKTPTVTTITNTLANISDATNPNNYMNKGTLVQLTGVILRYVGNNMYIQDKNGNAIYVYMGIEGNSIESLYSVGDTISIQGRLCEYGGQYQMSGIVFKSSTFKKVEGADAVAMPEPIQLTGNETVEELKALVGKLVKSTIKCTSVGSASKDGSFTLYATQKNEVKENAVSIRVNGSLAPGYDKDSFSTGSYEVIGIMGLYLEVDLQAENNYPSYQIVPGNRAVVDGVVVNEIVKK